jgi:hypothetical protein
MRTVNGLLSTAQKTERAYLLFPVPLHGFALLSLCSNLCGESCSSGDSLLLFFLLGCSCLAQVLCRNHGNVHSFKDAELLSPHALCRFFQSKPL